MGTLFRAAVAATFLGFCVVLVALAVWSRQAYPAEADDGFNAPQVVNSAAKSNRADIAKDLSRLSGDLSRLDDALDRADRSLQRMEDNTKRLGKSLQRLDESLKRLQDNLERWPFTGITFIQSAQPDQPACGPRVKVVAALEEKFGEVRRAMGLVSQTSIVELYVSPKGSWTALVTSSDGQSCIVAAGQHWSEMPKPKPTGPEA